MVIAEDKCLAYTRSMTFKKERCRCTRTTDFAGMVQPHSFAADYIAALSKVCGLGGHGEVAGLLTTVLRGLSERP